jgi:aryl-alcohol dehydrogenase-like predicted oxidoreductase
VNWIDTAPVYGLGHAEEVVSRTLRDIPQADRPYVFTKCSLVWDESDHSVPPRRVGTPANLRREVKALAEALKPVAARHGVTVSAVAIAWTLAWPG